MGNGIRRHSRKVGFSIRRWYRRRSEDVGRRMPALSTYLGHVNVAATYWYLSCTPELRAAASSRVEARWKGVGDANIH